MKKQGENKKSIAGKKGMTLIEVIIGLAICGIFVGVAIAAISPITDTYRTTENKSEAQMVAKNLMETIRGKTNTCTELVADNSGTQSIIKYDGKEIRVNSDGYLLINNNLAYDAAYYNNKTIYLAATQISKNKINVILSVNNEDGKTIAKIDADLEPVLQASEKQTEDEETEEDTYPGTDIVLQSNYWPKQSDYNNESHVIPVKPQGIFKYDDGNYYAVVINSLNLTKSQAASGPGGEAYDWYATVKMTGRIITDWTDGSQKSDLSRGDLVKTDEGYYTYIDSVSWAYAPTKNSKQWFLLPDGK